MLPPDNSGKTDVLEQPVNGSFKTEPAVETTQDKTEEEPGKEPEGGPEGDVKDQGQDESRMHVLGHDDNIRTKSLVELPADQVSSPRDDHPVPPQKFALPTFHLL